MSFNSGWVPEHYISSTVNSTYNTLGNAVPQTPTTDRRANRYTNCPTTLCLYTNPDGWECLELINCGDASDHFRDVHGIVGLAREVRLVCKWQGCGSGVSRHNYIRHIREYHLRHDRVAGHANQVVVRLGGLGGTH